MVDSSSSVGGVTGVWLVAASSCITSLPSPSTRISALSLLHYFKFQSGQPSSLALTTAKVESMIHEADSSLLNPSW